MTVTLVILKKEPINLENADDLALVEAVELPHFQRFIFNAALHHGPEIE